MADFTGSTPHPDRDTVRAAAPEHPQRDPQMMQCPIIWPRSNSGLAHRMSKRSSWRERSAAAAPTADAAPRGRYPRPTSTRCGARRPTAVSRLTMSRPRRRGNCCCECSSDIDVADRMLVLSTAGRRPDFAIAGGQSRQRGAHRDVARAGHLPAERVAGTADTRATVHTEIPRDSGTPQLIIRTGWATTSVEPIPVTPRRPLEEVVSAL